MPAEPSPFAPRTYPTSSLFLYVDGVDLTPWADRADLQAAAQVYEEGTTEEFTVTLRNYVKPQSESVGAPLPAIREGMVPVIYLQRHSTDPADYTSLFSGRVHGTGFTDTDYRGATVLSISTPVKVLKTVLRAILFYPQTEGDDIARLRALGRKWGHRDFDFGLVSASVSITYPLPRPTDDGLSYMNGEPFTVYENSTVDDIIRDIMSDPGQASDTGYPVPSRDWWWEGRFRDDADPTLGIRWHLRMMLPADAPIGPPLSDSPDALHANALLYDTGAAVALDYVPVIRRVQVAGNAIVSAPVPAMFVATGGTADADIYAPSAGWVRKYGGVDGAWDVTACDQYSYFSDFDFHFQVQETYLMHDPFQGDDQTVLGVTSMITALDPGFPKGQWYPAYLDTNEVHHNSMARIGNKARPFNQTNTAIAFVDARAATCIVRATVSHNVAGAAILVRATVDPTTLVLGSAIMLVAHAGTWHLVENSAGVWTTLASGHAMTEEQHIKINCKYNEIQVFFEDVEDMSYRQSAYTFNAHETLHGIGVWNSYDVDFWQCTFRDFSVTEFWGDKAIGIGDATSGSDWSWIGYGVVFNTNGTYTLVRGGAVVDTLGVGGYGQTGTVYTFADLDSYQSGHSGELPADVPYLWEDVLAAHDAFAVGFTYNDVFQMTTVVYEDTSTNPSVLYRKVQWWYQPGGAGAPVLLREEIGLAHDIIHHVDGAGPDVVWYHQVALKELGATFTNMGATGNYSNMFIPTGDLAAALSPLQGEYPATGTIQDDRLISYVARQRVAHGVLREFGEPRVNVTCTIHPLPLTPGAQVVQPYNRGDLLYFSSRRAGWIDDGVTDKRKLLTVRQIQRVEGGPQLKRPSYKLTLGNRLYDLTNPARSHMLQAGEVASVPYNYEVPELQGYNFVFSAPPEGDQFFGERMEIKVNALGKAAGGDLPTFVYPSGTRSMQLPYGTFPPGTVYEAQHRTIAANGTPSAWSPKYTGTAPPAPPYARPFNALLPLGNGVDILAVPMDATGAFELQVHEACRLTSWTLVLNNTGAISVDVQWVSDEARRSTGASAYATLCGSGVQPYTSDGVGDGTANQGSDFRGWDDHRVALAKGDWLRAVITVITGDPAATLGTLTLTFDRIGTAGT